MIPTIKKIKHFCIACGMTQLDNKWWKYILDNGAEGKKISEHDKKLLIKLIAFYKSKKLTP